MTLTDGDRADLVALRRDLHRMPELSGQEVRTARRIAVELGRLAPDALIEGLGGHGVAAVWQGAGGGPTVLFRCELDALPIAETGEVAHRSTVPGHGHLCGHDGHMATMMGLARCLARHPPARGRAVLLFQPAEETGAGAAAVLADPAFAAIAPDFAFALHNMPGLPLGHAGVAEGPVNCASRGLAVTLEGSPAHAADPESGRSPMAALAALMPGLTGLGRGALDDPDFAQVTVTHARMGTPAFGVAPGEATLFATLRTLTDERMAVLAGAALDLVTTTARAHGLAIRHRFEDVFHHCENDPRAVTILRRALDRLGMAHSAAGQPWRASEDFGRFGHDAPAALCLLGAGPDHPALHHSDYDFPDALIPPGVRLLEAVARDLLG